jgi:ANTAR domain-containing protein
MEANRPRSWFKLAQKGRSQSIRSPGVNEDAPQQAIDSLRAGSVDEAAVAVGRLLSVTEAAYERRAQLEQALQSRVAIEQAKGVVAERYRLDVDEAFDHIRRAARSNRMKLHELVLKIKPGEPTPEELMSQLGGLAASDRS